LWSLRHRATPPLVLRVPLVLLPDNCQFSNKGACGRFYFDCVILKSGFFIAFRLLASGLALLGLGACASKSLLSEVSSAVFFDALPFQAPAPLDVQLNPNYRYLHVTLTGGKPALAVLGYVDAHAQGDIEVWYSAQGEVLRLQNGRLVGVAGLPLEWRHMAYPQTPPAWPSVPSEGVRFTRVRDEQPGYRLGLVEQVVLTPLPKPPLDLPGPAFAVATWFQESYTDARGSSRPDAWFALGEHGGQKTIVYSRQCLSVTVCLTLQRWPLQKDPL
jgi:hypothetical protein